MSAACIVAAVLALGAIVGIAAARITGGAA